MSNKNKDSLEAEVKYIAHIYGYDQVIIYARRLEVPASATELCKIGTSCTVAYGKTPSDKRLINNISSRLKNVIHVWIKDFTNKKTQ